MENSTFKSPTGCSFGLYLDKDTKTDATNQIKREESNSNPYKRQPLTSNNPVRFPLNLYTVHKPDVTHLLYTPRVRMQRVFNICTAIWSRILDHALRFACLA